MSFDELKRKRSNWVQANRENNFEEGIKKLLTDLYPDNAHFIYELLQNAEDPEATVVRFTLDDGALEFEHNGRRLFTLKDVESITSIGASTKRDDETKIGKFGVGFKAVFAYTDTPVIHSGTHHFRIRDMVVPEEVAPDLRNPHAAETRFRFPFDHPAKDKRRAKNEIESALLGLSDNTLLFLSHIHTIEYLLPSGNLGQIKRLERDGGRIEIHSVRPDGTESKSHWLRFEKDIAVVDDDGSTKECRIAIAYAMAPKEGKKATDSEWQIVPLDRGQVSIYFPAEKETSNLRFHIHAPFASTVARDSVRDSEANARLLEQIALLAAESLHSIKDQGMLTVNFLATLPNPSDGLPKFYEPIRKHVVGEFTEHALTPTKNGLHAQSTALYRGPSRISEVIDDDDLSVLTGFAPPLWAANPPQTNQREDRFLESLEIDAWGWDALGKTFHWLSGEQLGAIESWLVEKDDRWMLRLYSLLGEAVESHSKNMLQKRIRLVRATDSSGRSMNVHPDEAHFAPTEDMAIPQGFYFVSKSVLEASRSDQQKRLARVFLEHMGVQPFDAVATLKLRLSAYKNNQVNPGGKHIEDVKGFIQLWKKDSTIASHFSGIPFLLGRDKDGRDVWRNSRALCLDDPYMASGLGEHVDIHSRFPLSAVYKQRLPALLLKPFHEFLREIGVAYELTVERVDTKSNPELMSLRVDYNVRSVRWTDSAIDRDHTIAHIEKYIAKRSVTASRLIWNALIKADGDATKAKFRPNQQYMIREVPSQLVHHLRAASWIPDKHGVFRAPKDMTAGELHADFPYDARNGLLTAIGFGLNERQRSEAYQASNEWAKKIGYSSVDEATEIAAMVRASGKSAAEIRSLFAPRDAFSLPTKAVPNPERRRKGIIEQREGAPDRESVKRERAVIAGTPEDLASAKAYLRPMYTTVEGRLVCQCCRLEMPFKVNGMHYFEAVKLVDNMDKHLYQCRIALCPNCAAMYKHARETDDEVLLERLSDHGASDESVSAELEVALAGKAYRLWFVYAHLFDVKELLLST